MDIQKLFIKLAIQLARKPHAEEQKAPLNRQAPLPRAILFPAPSVEPVDAFGILHPDETGIDNVYIVVDYPDLPNPGHILSFSWNGNILGPVGATTRPVRMPVPPAMVIAAAGKIINVIYTVTDANTGTSRSEVLQQIVETYTAPRPPALDVLEDSEPGHVLDISNPTKITARVPDYGMQAGDNVSVRWAGNAVHDTARLVTVPGAMDFNLPLAWAEEDANDLNGVTLTYTYERAGAAPVVSLPLVITVLKQGTPLDLIPPTVVEASNGQLDFTWLSDGMATVRVPQYPGMAVGHTVRVRWLCRVAYLSEIKTVETVGPIDFKIPRDEVIDSIGSLVDVNYTVEVSLGNIQASTSYGLIMRPQPLNLVAPSIYFDNTNVRVSYLNSLKMHSVAVRWKGVVERQTDIQHPEQNGYYLDFAIPSSWVTENRGREVLVNYAVGVGDNPLIFSQITRKYL